jgi:hypothetical protein
MFLLLPDVIGRKKKILQITESDVPPYFLIEPTNGKRK